MSRTSRIACLISLAVLAGFGNLYAQGPDSLWHRAYGDSFSDFGFSVVETHDGYYVAAGQMQVYNPDSNKIYLDVYVLKLTAGGDTVWARTYGGVLHDGSRSIIEASDGNFVVTGYTDSWGAGDLDIYVAKIDPGGSLIWERTIGDSRGDEESFCVREAPDSTYRIVGTTDAFGTDDVLLVGIGPDGNGIWQRAYSITGNQTAHEIAFSPDGYLLIIGSNFGPTVDVYLMKTETDGDTLWTRTYNFGPLDYGMSVQPVSQDEYILAGYSQAVLAPFYNAFLLDLQSDGGVNWSRFYGGQDHDLGESVRVMDGGGFVFTGRTASYGAHGDDVWLVRTDAGGDTLWTKTYGGSLNENGGEVQVTSDGGFIIAGYTNSFGNGAFDLYLVKAGGDPSGIVSRQGVGEVVSLKALPNPSRAGVRISCQAVGVRDVDLVICDILGRRVRQLGPGCWSAGIRTVEWDGCDEKGRRVRPGVYFLKASTATASVTRKVVMLR